MTWQLQNLLMTQNLEFFDLKSFKFNRDPEARVLCIELSKITLGSGKYLLKIVENLVTVFYFIDFRCSKESCMLKIALAAMQTQSLEW